ncbi:MAG TPA: DUF2269 family protein [Chloroflexota bacterium]|jgi:hypothetical protein
MTGLYPYLIFVHVCSVIGLFAAIALEAAAMYRIGTTRSATVIRENLSTLGFLEKALPGAAGLVLISGVSMVLLRWGWSPAWIDSALAVLVLLGVLGPIVTGRRVTRIRAALARTQHTGDELPEGVVPLAADPVLLGYAPIPAVMGLAIVALMVFKPDWTGSLEVLCAALIVGLALSQVIVRRRPSAQHTEERATRAAQA